MSKKSRARRKEKRDKMKAAKKSAMKARYASMRDAGITKKSRRARMNQARRKKNTLRPYRERQRIPFPYHLWRNKDGSYKPGMPHWAWLRRPEAQE